MGTSDAKFSGEIFRKDHPMILAKNRQLASIGGVRLAYDAADLLAGTVLARNTVSGMYQRYNDGASSGLDTAKCVLFEDVPTVQFASTGDTQLARGIFGGELFKAKLIGLDANGITDLGARSFIEADGVEILKF